MAPVYEIANVAHDHQQLTMTDAPPRRRQARLRLPAAREALRGRQRLRQARQLVARRRRRQGNLLDPGHNPHENAQFLVLLRRRHPRRRQAPAVSCAPCRLRRQRPPPRRQRSPPAIISIFLGDMLNDVIEQIKKSGNEPRPRKGMEHMTSASSTLPPLAEGRGRPQPYQPVRLHRQQVRVPRRRLGPSRSRVRSPRSTPSIAESLDKRGRRSSRSSSVRARTPTSNAAIQERHARTIITQARPR